MPKDPRIKKVLVIGSGPIIIGQAAEFDYSGTQACRALKAEGIETVLLNSNPATIMTDPDVADHVYIEPMTLEVVERILDIEKPDSGTLRLSGPHRHPSAGLQARDHRPCRGPRAVQGDHGKAAPAHHPL